MTIAAFLLILFSVFLHTGWNLLLKEDKPSLAFCLLINVCGFLCMLPCLFLAPLPLKGMPGGFWICLGGSIIGELLYYASLVQGYRHFDFSVFYPVGRALPVAMLAIGAFFLPLGRQSPSGWALAGMAVIFFGCMCMSLQGKASRTTTKSLVSGQLWLWTLIGATGACFYTGFDNAAANLIKESGVEAWGIIPACAYNCLVNAGLVAGNGLVVSFAPHERRKFREYLHSAWLPLAAGFCDALCYSLVLMAYTKANNSAIVFAFRQLGLPLGFLAGVFFLHEKAHAWKLFGLACIVVGLLLTIIPQ